jgi:hypothetical protein
MPDRMMGWSLSTRYNYLREDITVTLQLAIDRSGQVVASTVDSVVPRAHSLANDLGIFEAQRWRDARFEAKGLDSFPYSFRVVITYRAPRDAFGNLR